MFSLALKTESILGRNRLSRKQNCWQKGLLLFLTTVWRGLVSGSAAKGGVEQQVQGVVSGKARLHSRPTSPNHALPISVVPGQRRERNSEHCKVSTKSVKWKSDNTVIVNKRLKWHSEGPSGLHTVTANWSEPDVVYSFKLKLLFLFRNLIVLMSSCYGTTACLVILKSLQFTGAAFLVSPSVWVKWLLSSL